MPDNLQILLNRLKLLPVPEAPVPASLGPLDLNTSAAYGALNPEPVPPQFAQPAAPDMGFVNQYAGPAPERPVIQPATRLQKIAAALMGFSEGFAGRGPEYLRYLDEQRNRPIREYEAQRERYEQRRTAGIELAERRAEREADRVNRANELLYENEYKKWLAKNSDRSDESKERMRQSFTLLRDARAAQLEEERAQRLEHRQRLDDARQWAGRLGTGPGAAPPHIAKELGEFYANVRQTVSPAAAKWVNAQARRAEILARPAAGGGSAAASRREVQDLQRRTAQAAAGIAGLEKLARQAMESPEAGRAPILNQMRSMAATLQAQFPELVETGEHNGWPFARLKLRGSQPQRQQPQQQPQSQADPAGLLR